MGTFRLILKSDFVLDLKNTFYVWYFLRNLFFLSRFVNVYFSFLFQEFTFSIFDLVGTRILVDNLYKCDLNTIFLCNYLVILSDDVNIKHVIVNESFLNLWHKRLGYISIELIKRFENNEILESLDFTNFGTYLSHRKKII